MPGRTLGVATSQSCGETQWFNYNANSVTTYVYVATIPCIITSCVVRIRVGSTSGTVTLVRCPTGTAPANGTAMTAAIDISATPTADTSITIALIPGNNSVNVTLNPGDALGLVFAGTMTNANGVVQAFVEPLT